MTKLSEPQKRTLPLRIGVFTNVDHAKQAVRDLQAAGFTSAEITVVCSDKIREAHFREFEHQEPAGTFTPEAAAAGSVIGATVGGISAAALALATGGVALLIGGAVAMWTGGVIGGLVGAMMTRGVERELADYYDQAVTAGKILVAAEATGARGAERLTTAERILANAGAEPLPLAES